MSSKIQHVQDNAVVERRLRPIYDWLDIGNNKKALQECEKVLKKTPNLHCAKALKALTLHRMGKEQLAIEILDNLTLEKPTDDATLQAMTLCYRELQQLDKICKLYETAVKLDPNNEELHTHLFMSYARIFDFKSQQKTAMQLYKFKPKTPYCCWAVMSIILQATRSCTTINNNNTTNITNNNNHNNGNNDNNTNNNNSDDDNNSDDRKDRKKRLLLLNLAERMMDKLIIDNKLDAEQEIQLYIMILELQNKFIDILKLLDGPLGNKLICTNQPFNRLKYLKKLQLWHDVNLLCKTILVDNIDRWDVWKDYINSVFEILDQKSQKDVNNHESTTNVENENDSVDDTPEKCHEFICRIVENTTDNSYRLRGPYLARFELYKKLLERNLNPIELLGDLIELFIEYFRKFGYKTCCVSDLRLYLNLLKQQQQQQIDLSTKLLNEIGVNSVNVPKNEQQMRQHLTAIQLTRLCGLHRNLTKEHLLALITSYSLHYQHGYQNYGRNLLQTDIGPSDQYAILATHLLYDLAKIDNTTEPILAGLILLDNLLKNSPSNFHAKLLSIRLYHTVGGTLGAQNMYNNLDLRHLQLDSLGFVHCARLPTTGLFSLYTNLCDATLKFFSSNYKDSSDHITFSYKYGSFIKLDEFMDFRERLNNSIHYTTCAIDRIVLTLIDCTNLDALYNLDISPKDDKIDWEHLRDNHDLSVYISWDPERVDCHPEEQQEIKELFQQNVDYLKLRTNILWSLSNSVNIIKTQDSNLRLKHIENLNEILNDWDNFIKTVHKKNYTSLKQDLVTLPLPSRLHGALDVKQFDILINCFKVFLNVANENYQIDDLLKQIEQSFNDLIKTFKERSITKDICIDLIQRRLLMEHIVNSVEIFSISTLICLLCNDLSKPLQQSKKTRKQGGGGGGNSGGNVGGANLTNNQQNNRRDWLLSFTNSLKSTMNELYEIVENLSNFTATYDLTRMFEILNLNDDIDNNHDNIVDNNRSSDVNENITKSYQYACREIQRVLQSKVKMLNCV